MARDNSGQKRNDHSLAMHYLKEHVDLVTEHLFTWVRIITNKKVWNLDTIQRYVEMISFLPFGNPWGYINSKEFLETASKALEKKTKLAEFLYVCKKILSDFLHKKVWIQPKVWTISFLFFKH